MYRIRAVVKGRVQGVGFRWFVQKNALEFELTGYVRNLPNGDVELVVEGSEKEVEKLLDKVRKGPAFSKVSDLFTEKLPEDSQFNSFEITY